MYAPPKAMITLKGSFRITPANPYATNSAATTAKTIAIKNSKTSFIVENVFCKPNDMASDTTAAFNHFSLNVQAIVTE